MSTSIHQSGFGDAERMANAASPNANPTPWQDRTLTQAKTSEPRHGPILVGPNDISPGDRTSVPGLRGGSLHLQYRESGVTQQALGSENHNSFHWLCS